MATVCLGEAAAGIVYRTDANAAKGAVETVIIPPGINVIAEYPVASLAGATHPQRARAWVALPLSPAGQAALQRAGFRSIAKADPAQ